MAVVVKGRFTRTFHPRAPIVLAQQDLLYCTAGPIVLAQQGPIVLGTMDNCPPCCAYVQFWYNGTQ